MASKNTTKTAGGSAVTRILKSIFLHPFSISIALAVALLVCGIWGVKMYLNKYTNHNKEIIQPDLKGLTLIEAEQELKKKGLKGEVVDSVYVYDVPKGCVVRQVPPADQRVKEGRSIFLYIRASEDRKVKLPDYKGQPLRTYRASLESAGFKVKDIKFVKGAFRNIVVGVMRLSTPVKPGESLVAGTELTLNVAKGSNNDIETMPNLWGMTVEQARGKVETLALNMDVIFDATPSSEANKKYYKVYSQTPASGAKLTGDESVTIFVTTTAGKLTKPAENEAEQE